MHQLRDVFSVSKSTSRSAQTEQARCVSTRTAVRHAACYLSALRPCRASITLSHGIAGFVCELRPQTAVAERCMFQSVYPHNCPQPDNVVAFEQVMVPHSRGRCRIVCARGCIPCPAAIPTTRSSCSHTGRPLSSHWVAAGMGAPPTFQP